MVHTTLFVATDEDLGRLFPSFRQPLAEPITRVGRNPLSGQIIGAKTWDPGAERPSPVPAPPSVRHRDGAAVRPPSIPAMDAVGEKLEESAPHRLRALPHVATAWVTGIELGALAKVLAAESAPARIVEPRDDDGFIDSLSSGARAPLAALADDDIPGAAERWARELGRTPDDAHVWAIWALRALAREAIATGGNVFVHIAS
ncbi:MAG: hypothetical protein KC657_28005 [Myxococcales bacterium]|nr:hypothetical protein [Myxococcales bacterium]